MTDASHDSNQATIRRDTVASPKRASAFDALAMAPPESFAQDSQTIKKMPTTLEATLAENESQTAGESPTSVNNSSEGKTVRKRWASPVGSTDNMSRLMSGNWETNESPPKSSRFDGHGSYLNACQGEGRGDVCLVHGNFGKDLNKSPGPSAAFAEGETKRSAWVDPTSETPQKLGDMTSDFNHQKEHNTHFRSEVDRFNGHGAFVKLSTGTGHHTLGHTDKTEELSKNMGCLDMSAPEKHRRFSNLGSIYANNGCGRGGIGLSHKSIVADIFASASNPTAAFAEPNTPDYNSMRRTKWMFKKDHAERANQPLSNPKSDFDKPKEDVSGSVFKTTTSRFEGQGSYITAAQGNGAKHVGLAHEDAATKVSKMGGYRMGHKKAHGRFSNAHSLYKPGANKDVDSIGLGHGSVGATGCTSDSGTAGFLTKKETGKWLENSSAKYGTGYENLGSVRSSFQTKKMSNAVSLESSAVPRFAGLNSYLSTPSYVSKDIGGVGLQTGLAKSVEKKMGGGGVRMTKSRRSRFSMMGGIHQRKNISDDVGRTHGSMVKSRNSAMPSPAFRGKATTRSSWLKKTSNTSTPVRSHFGAGSGGFAKPNPKPSPSFRSTVSRFGGYGSHIRFKTPLSSANTPKAKPVARKTPFKPKMAWGGIPSQTPSSGGHTGAANMSSNNKENAFGISS